MRALRPRGMRDDSGAIAVFVCLVMVFVLLPLSGLATTAYVRSGVQAEHVRATDSGALAGAASLVLLDVAALPENPFNQISTDGQAFGIASSACDAAALRDNGLSKDYAKRLTCTARFSPDTSLGSCLDGVLDVAESILPIGIPTEIDTGPVPDPGGVLGGIVDDIEDETGLDTGDLTDRVLDGIQLDLRDTTAKLAPALLHNGVRVTMTYTVKGPLDGFIGKDTSTRTAVSTARRRFKPLLPSNLNLLVADPNLAPVYTQLSALLLTLEQLVGEGLTDLPVPLPEPVRDPVGNLPAGCRPAVLEIIEDLRDALKVNDQEQDLLGCLREYVLGVADSPLRPLANDPRCVRRLFRAQLAPNA